MDIYDSSGNAEIDRALGTLIEQIEALVPDAGLGFYLHGSSATGNARPQSDVDVLALATRPFSEQQRYDAEVCAAELAARLDIPFDFHLHPVQALIADPYVDLRRTGKYLAGVDVRPLMPAPTLDALAREAVLIMCLIATDKRNQAVVAWPLAHPNPDDTFFGRLQDTPPRGFAKDLTWITSARLAGNYGYAPIGAADALGALGARDDPFSEWVNTTVHFCQELTLASATESERQQLQAMCHRALAFENETFAILHAAAKTNSGLGEKCAKVLDTYITFL